MTNSINNLMHTLTTAYTRLVDAIKRAFPWIGAAPAPAAGPVSTPNLNAVLLNLCDGDNELAMYVLKWIAYPYRRPGARMAQALWIYGGQGNGKSLFFERAIAPIYASHAVTVRNEFHNYFNEWVHGIQLAIVEEFNGERGAAARAKQMMTSDELVIERKAKAPLRMKNTMNFVFLSGDMNPLAPSVDGRRFVMIDAPPALACEVYAAAAVEIENGASEAFREYFLKIIDLKGFDRYSTPYDDLLPAKAVA
jgi:putative DNA primase/helicase